MDKKTREIKFRIWDKKEKCFYQSTYEFYKGKLFHLLMNPQTGHLLIRDMKTLDGCHLRGVEDDRYILMQFTGLHDKNGKEIYEGDIVKWDDRAAGDDGMVWEGVVRFKEGAFIAEKQDELIGWMWNRSSLEVIGNIYENPKLFEENE